jgi:hypothetical protein
MVKNGIWIKQNDSMHSGLISLKDGNVIVDFKALSSENQMVVSSVVIVALILR